MVSLDNWLLSGTNENQILSEIIGNNNNKQTLPDIVVNGFKCTFFLLIQAGVPTVKHFPQYVIVDTTT